MPVVTARPMLERLGIADVNAGASDGEWIETPGAKEFVSYSPIDGTEIARVRLAGVAEYERVMKASVETFARWRMVPAPKRGVIVREIGDELRKHKDDLGALVTLEMGKILAEGLGEVQEMIDISDFAVGLSRQLYGLTMHSERPGTSHVRAVASARRRRRHHRLQFSRGRLVLERAHRGCLRRLRDLEALAQNAAHRDRGPQHLQSRAGTPWLAGRVHAGDRREPRSRRPPAGTTARIPLVSATGSTRMGRSVAEVVGQRLGRTLLELGGNNGIIVTDDANLDLVLRACVVRRGRHGRPALHHRCAACSSTQHRAGHDRAPRRRLAAGAHRRSAGPRHPHGSAHRSRCGRHA